MSYMCSCLLSYFVHTFGNTLLEPFSVVMPITMLALSSYSPQIAKTNKCKRNSVGVVWKHMLYKYASPVFAGRLAGRLLQIQCVLRYVLSRLARRLQETSRSKPALERYCGVWLQGVTYDFTARTPHLRRLPSVSTACADLAAHRSCIVSFDYMQRICTSGCQRCPSWAINGP